MAVRFQKGIMSERILIIDDEQHIRRMMRLTLETAGYEVGEAPDGAEGIQTLWRRFRLVVGGVGPKNAGHGWPGNSSGTQKAEQKRSRGNGDRVCINRVGSRCDETWRY